MLRGIRAASRAGVAAMAVVLVSLGLASVAHADMYGDPATAATYWRYQHQEDCGLMAIADVVGQLTGREPHQLGIELRGIFTPSASHSGSVYLFDGTSPQDMVMLLRHYGVTSNLTTGNTMQGLEQSLAQGHKVIAAINAETIWNVAGSRANPDHAVVVTGVDTGANVVHLNDSGTPNGRNEQIPLNVFSQAWSTSNNLLIVTDATGYGSVVWHHHL